MRVWVVRAYLGILGMPRLHMTNSQKHTHSPIDTHAQAACASKWRCLDGVQTAYLSMCDRLTAQAPSTLSTIIMSRVTHINTRGHTLMVTLSDNIKMTKKFVWLIKRFMFLTYDDSRPFLMVENIEAFVTLD